MSICDVITMLCFVQHVRRNLVSIGTSASLDSDICFRPLPARLGSLLSYHRFGGEGCGKGVVVVVPQPPGQLFPTQPKQSSLSVHLLYKFHPALNPLLVQRSGTFLGQLLLGQVLRLFLGKCSSNASSSHQTSQSLDNRRQKSCLVPLILFNRRRRFPGLIYQGGTPSLEAQCMSGLSPPLGKSEQLVVQRITFSHTLVRLT